MTDRKFLRHLGVLLLVLSLAAAGCRGEEEAAAPETEAETPEDDTDAAADEDTETEAALDVTFDLGVTEEPCPDAVNEDNGCIYLGTISDLTQGPFSGLGPSITEAQAAFWRTVNEDGGIGGQFDVDVSTYVRDNLYNPETQNQVYQEIKGEILALAQTLGSPTTAAIIDDLREEQIVGAPASWTSAWAFEDVILESGVNYCIESMNSIDYALENFDGPIETVMAIHYPGDYGDDAAAGTRHAAEEHDLEFIDVPTNPGPDNQAGATDAVVNQSPDLVIVTTNPTDMATIVGQAAAQGFQGRFIGTSPTWNPGVIDSPAVDAVEALYIQSGPWQTYASDTEGHQAMRDALGIEDGNDGFTSGWAWSYPLKAALEAAVENGDLTRAGLFEAVTSLSSVDYQGMVPDIDYSGDPNDALVRGTFFSEVDRESSTGVRSLTDEAYTGPTAEAFELTEPCFEML